MDDRLTSIEHALTALQISSDGIRAELAKVQASNEVINAELVKVQVGHEVMNARLQMAIDFFAEHYATKAEIEMVKTAVSDSRIEFHKAMREQTWRLVTWMTVVCSALTTGVYFIARNVH
jgi:maltooligosyltrehalose synthase